MKNNVQEKKNLKNTILNILFKILIVTAVAIFAFIAYDKADFSSSSMTFGKPEKKKSDPRMPSDLKWFNSFKGVENVPSN